MFSRELLKIVLIFDCVVLSLVNLFVQGCYHKYIHIDQNTSPDLEFGKFGYHINTTGIERIPCCLLPASRSLFLF